MIPEIERIYDNTINKWRLVPKSIVIYQNESLSLIRLALLTAKKVIDKDKNRVVNIIVPNQSYIDTIVADEIATHNELSYLLDFIHIYPVDNKNVIFTHSTLLILISPERFIIDKVNKFPTWLLNTAYNFLLVVSRSYDVSVNFKDIPVVENLTKFNSIVVSKYKYTSYVLPVQMNEKDTTLYNEYTTSINDTINLFGSPNICYDIIADRTGTIREKLAHQHGWSRDLDLSNSYSSEIHNWFSPNAIYNRAKEFQDFITNRDKLISNCEIKTKTICDIISKFPNSKIGIISKHSTNALKITKVINSTFSSLHIPNILADALDVEVHTGICVDFNNNLETIKRTVGGKEKTFGVTTQNKRTMKLFNESKSKIVSLSNTVPNYAEFEFDIFIITSPFCSKILDLMKRCKKFNIYNNGMVIYLYAIGTKEGMEIKNNNYFSAINGKIKIESLEDIK